MACKFVLYNIYTVIYCVFAQSIRKLGQCVLWFVLFDRSIFFKTIIGFRRTEKCIDIVFGSVACNCCHYLGHPFVSRVNCVEKFVFTKDGVANINCFFSLMLLGFISVNPKYTNLVQPFFKYCYQRWSSRGHILKQGVEPNLNPNRT